MSDQDDNDEDDDDEIEEIDILYRQMKSKEHFLEILKLLRKDYQQNRKEWENQTLEAYLEAMEAFTHDLGAYYENQGVEVDLDNPGWRVFTDILLASRVYE